jgi:hypothetical protein
MKNYKYSISQFRWDKNENCFYASAPYLWDENRPECVDAFPNGKKKFIIQNPKTNGFRRFSFLKEYDEKKEVEYATYTIEQTDTIWEFVSEDGIKCRISQIP